MFDPFHVKIVGVDCDIELRQIAVEVITPAWGRE